MVSAFRKQAYLASVLALMNFKYYFFSTFALQNFAGKIAWRRHSENHSKKKGK
jgi:hypothetical protein